MVVFVDDMFKYPMGQFRHMKMSHMTSDNEDELHKMADKIGVARKHYQFDHYDICMSMRKLAIQAGAIPITLKQLALINRLFKQGADSRDLRVQEILKGTE